MVALIQAAIPSGSGGIWADLGAGGGNFTRALGTLLGEHRVIYAVDRALPAAPDHPGEDVHWIQADFTGPVNLPALDGILMANALHFVKDQETVLGHVCGYLRPGGRFVLVEYDLDRPLSYIPYPVSYHRFERLAQTAGLGTIKHTGERRSPTTGIVMYSACGLKPD